MNAHDLNRQPATRLGCERLEARENPAGNVITTILPDGVLYIRGDALDNRVSVQQYANGDLFAYGVAGTTVNGQSVVYLGNGYPTGVAFVMDAGNDLLEMIGVRTGGGIWGQMGNENDGLALYNVMAGALQPMMEGGDDVVVTDSVYVSGYCEINGGTGFDTIDYRTYGIYAPSFFALPNMEKQVGGPYGYY